MSPLRVVFVLLSVIVLFASCISGTTHQHHRVHRQPRKLFEEEVARGPAATPRRKSYVPRDSRELHSGLFKRDSCNVSFPGRYTDACGSEATTCCIVPGMARPACVQILGKGACCTEHIDCYVDTRSDCGDPDSEHCTSDICCPKNMHCSEDVEYNDPEDIRCYFDRAFIPDYIITTTARRSFATNTPSPLRAISSADETTLESPVSKRPSSPYDPNSPVTTDWTTESKASATKSSDQYEPNPVETRDPESGITMLAPNATAPLPTDGMNAGIRGAAIAGVAVGAVLTTVCISSIAGYCIFQRIQKRSQTKPTISYPILPPEMSDNGQIFESQMEQIYEAQTARGPFYESGSTQVYEAPSEKNEYVYEIGSTPPTIHEAPSGKGAFFDPRAPPSVERHARVEMPADPPRSMHASILKVFPGLSELRRSNIGSASPFTHGRNPTSTFVVQDINAVR